ncbi:MAG: TrmH family RNA methyltransferase [Paludibaculum sp.]
MRLVHPYEVAFREAVSAVGAAQVMKDARVFETVAEAVADCTLVVGATGLGHRQPQHAMHRLEKGARLIRRHMTASNVALLFGSEKFGLGNSDVAHCHWLTHIPTRAQHDSMNLAQVVAVCLYELIRLPTAARHLPEAAELAGSRRGRTVYRTAGKCSTVVGIHRLQHGEERA